MPASSRRGRPPKGRTERQDHRVMVNLTAEEFRAIEKVAEGESVASFIREEIRALAVPSAAPHRRRRDERKRLRALARALERVVKRDEDGRFDGLEGVGSQILLLACVEAHSGLHELPNSDQIAFAGVRRAVGMGELSADTLRKGLAEAARESARAPEQEFTQVGRIGVSPRERPIVRELGPCSIRVAKSPPSKLPLARSESRAAEHLPRAAGSGFAWTAISVRARTASAAETIATDAIDLLRGIWTYWLAPGWSLAFGRARPRGPVIAGPWHAVFDRKSASSGDAELWYEPFFDLQQEPVSLSAEQWRRLVSAELRVRRRLEALPSSAYAEQLRAAFRLYARVFESPDYDSAFLKLWGLLERLTATGPTDSHVTTVRRASFLSTDPPVAEAILDALRRRRIRAVHFGEETAEEFRAQWVFNAAKAEVDQLFHFHLGRGMRFNNMQEAAQAMDLSADESSLQREIELRRWALKFRGGREHRMI